MGTTSPVSAEDDLFAVKGFAAPLDKERQIPASSEAPRYAPDEDTSPLPGIFDNDDNNTAPDGPDGPEPAEPPPAASLLSIAAQGSAARSRIDARTPTLPESETAIVPEFPEEDTIPDTDGREDVTEDSAEADAKVYLPVLVHKNLPSIIAQPDGATTAGYKKSALLAASVALLVAGAIAIFAGQTKPDPQVTDAGPVSPPVTAPTTAIPAAAPEQPKSEILSVRFDRPGQAIVTGRAAPQTELIVLRDRQPLGTTRSSDTGEWTLTARVPTRTEQHEISVVPMQIDTSLTVDQPSFVPRPQRRPDVPPPTAGVSTRTYFAQIASLPSAADAAREAQKLTVKLAGTVAAEKLSIRAGRLDQGRTVYRVAIEGFTTKSGAASACAAILALKTPCLVMRAP
jgi:hypothetical protein